MKRKFPCRLMLLVPALLAVAVSCMDYDRPESEEFTPVGRGVFIVNEGNFMAGTATLSHYDPASRQVENEVFFRANSMKLGDVAQTMAIRGGRGYIAVNNSGVIFVIDIETFQVLGLIRGVTSPRYIHFLSDEKAYVTDLYLPRITVFNPLTCEVIGTIDTRGHTSTEQMAQQGKYVFTNCWSYDDQILVIDSERDEVVDSIAVGIQPTALTLDRHGKLWVLTDGGFDGSPFGSEAPALYRIDAESRRIEKRFTFPEGDHPSELCLNGAADTLYFLNRSLYRMAVTDERLPVRPFVEEAGTIYFGLGVDPL
ncbi:MAG: YncE family protein, partial [Rikenellaceae bacterium]|nr:YncE family protein [Rikenellaceae bacterium]